MVEVKAEELAASAQRARGQVGQEGGLERVEPDLGVVIERQHVGLDRARQRVDAGDRLRVDLVPQVGARHLAPGDDRVGERLQGGVGRADVRPGRRRGQEVARHGRRRRHQRRHAERTRPLEEPATRELREESLVLRAPCHPARER